MIDELFMLVRVSMPMPRLVIVLTIFSFCTASAEPFTDTLSVGKARIELFIEDKPFDLSTDELRAWVLQRAEIVARFYDGFPVGEAFIAIRGRRGGRVMMGRAFGLNGAVVNVDVGLVTTEAILYKDWVLIHEMIHLAFPSVPRRHHWIEEGLSTYIESVSRAQAGKLDAASVWLGLMDGIPKGLPKSGDRGLDNTPTWGRTYWGGALFSLLADIRIREATNGEKSLRDGLRGIVQAGYDITHSSDLRPVLEIADAATGVAEITALYDQMRSSPYPTEVDTLWRELGLEIVDGGIVFDDAAPRSAVRKALTSPGI